MKSRVPSPDQNVIGIGRNPDFDICSDISYHMNSYDTYTKTEYICLKLISKKKNETWAPGSSTCTRRHANINRHENNNFFIEHFRQQFSSQNAKNAVSENQDFNTFWGSMPLHPPPLPPPPSDSRLQHSRDSSVIEEYLDFTYSKGWTV